MSASAGMPGQGTINHDRINERLARIEELLERLLQQAGRNQSPPVPEGVGHGPAKLMALARQDPRAAIEEARRLSRLETARRREERKKKMATGGKKYPVR